MTGNGKVLPSKETARPRQAEVRKMNGIDYLKEDIYNTERAKMRFVAEWDKVCKEIRQAMREKSQDKKKGKAHENI